VRRWRAPHSLSLSLSLFPQLLYLLTLLTHFLILPFRKNRHNNIGTRVMLHVNGEKSCTVMKHFPHSIPSYSQNYRPSPSQLCMLKNPIIP